MEDIHPFLGEVIKSMVETGKKLGRIPDAFKKTYKSSEALPIKEEPAWSEDDVLRSLEADELEKLETQEEYEAGLRMEAFLRDTVRFNLHEEFDYGLRRTTRQPAPIPCACISPESRA